MANNIVSEWLEDEIRLDYVDGTNYAQAMKARDFAATPDRAGQHTYSLPCEEFGAQMDSQIC